MTEARWRAAIAELRAKLDRRVPRKVAMLAIRDKYEVGQASIYVWAKVFKVSLK